MELESRKMSIDLLLDLVAVLDTDANSILKIEFKEEQASPETNQYL